MRIVVRFRRGSLILAPVRLRHRSVCRRSMVLDTGARLTILDIESARRIGLEMREVPGTRLVGVAGSAPVSVGTVDAVSLLGQTVRDLEVICHPLNEQVGFDGVLGMDFLQHFNFEVHCETEVFTAAKWRE